MRNLPRAVETLKQRDNDHSSEDSYNTICPAEWPPMNEKNQSSSSYGRVRKSFSETSDASQSQGKLSRICNYLAENRARLLLTFISLVFLSLFLVVIYRKFGWIKFLTVLGAISVPVILILIYSRRLEIKEQENECEKNQRLSERRRITPSIDEQQSVFMTELEMRNLKTDDQIRKATETWRKYRKPNDNQRTIVIKLPATDLEQSCGSSLKF